MRDVTLKEVLAPIVRDLLADARSGALMVSQQNCVAVLGVSVRAHLDNCRRPDFKPRVLKVGKLRLVDASEYREWLGAVDEDHRVTEPTATTTSADEADQFLSEFNFRPIARKAR